EPARLVTLPNRLRSVCFAPTSHGAQQILIPTFPLVDARLSWVRFLFLGRAGYSFLFRLFLVGNNHRALANRELIVFELSASLRVCEVHFEMELLPIALLPFILKFAPDDLKSVDALRIQIERVPTEGTFSRSERNNRSR